jgi:hypothetical protein
MWVQFQSRAGDTATVVVRKPGGAVYGSFDYVSQDAVQFGWFWAYYFFNPYVPPADYGTWHLQLQRRGVVIADRPFTVAATTTFGPRFWPRAGRSFRINGSAQRDTLRRLPYGPPVTYALLNAPAFVSLVQDSIVQVAASSTQSSRSSFFQVVMTDGAARRDTAFYHVVDMSKPLDPRLDAPEPPAPGRLAIEAGPQPAAGSVNLSFTLPRSGRVSLSLYDATGRRRRTLIDEARDAGAWSVTWDGRDDGGSSVAPGVYFARLSTAGGTANARLVRLAR